VHRNNIPVHIQQDTTLHSLFYMEPALHVSSGTTTHHQERKQLYLLEGWLTVHRSITLIDFQLDAQNSYLFIYNTFIKILYMFRALPRSSSRGLRRNRIHAASGIVTL
jgi:hypothetical protein